jgi:hypothetical protein
METTTNTATIDAAPRRVDPEKVSIAGLLGTLAVTNAAILWVAVTYLS